MKTKQPPYSSFFERNSVEKSVGCLLCRKNKLNRVEHIVYSRSSVEILHQNNKGTYGRKHDDYILSAPLPPQSLYI